MTFPIRPIPPPPPKPSWPWNEEKIKNPCAEVLIGKGTPLTDFLGRPKFIVQEPDSFEAEIKTDKPKTPGGDW